MSESPIDLRPMLDSIDTDNLLGMINPIENAPVANTQFAQARQIIGHTDQSPMDHNGSIFRQPHDLSLNRCTDNSIELL